MRYWPLTAVLLAFWLGRETGAQGREGKKDAFFDSVEVKSLHVGGQDGIVIDRKGIVIAGPGQGSLELRPTGLALKSGAKPRFFVVHENGKTAVALLSASGKPRITFAESKADCAISVSGPDEFTLITPKGVNE